VVEVVLGAIEPAQILVLLLGLNIRLLLEPVEQQELEPQKVRLEAIAFSLQ
jgi:hypothetical protein